MSRAASERPGAPPESGLGGYELLQPIGRGSGGAIFQARRAGSDAGPTFAFKVLFEALAGNPELGVRLLEAGRVAAGLHHRNIAQVHDCGISDTTFFVAMEQVAGWDLGAGRRRLLALGKRLPVEIALRIAGDACAALQHAHDGGANGTGRPLVHGGLAPANLMVSDQGVVKVLDFGISAVAGPPAARPDREPFWSPEQLRGQPVDARTDLFSLGLTLFVLLTGWHAFQRGSVAATRQAMVNDEPRDPRSLRPDLPAGVVALLRRALEPDRERRFGSAAELGAALAELPRSGEADLLGFFTELFTPEVDARPGMLATRLGMPVPKFVAPTPAAAATPGPAANPGATPGNATPTPAPGPVPGTSTPPATAGAPDPLPPSSPAASASGPTRPAARPNVGRTALWAAASPVPPSSAPPTPAYSEAVAPGPPVAPYQAAAPPSIATLPPGWPTPSLGSATVMPSTSPVWPPPAAAASSVPAGWPAPASVPSPTPAMWPPTPVLPPSPAAPPPLPPSVSSGTSTPPPVPPGDGQSTEGIPMRVLQRQLKRRPVQVGVIAGAVALVAVFVALAFRSGTAPQPEVSASAPDPAVLPPVPAPPPPSLPPPPEPADEPPPEAPPPVRHLSSLTGPRGVFEGKALQRILKKARRRFVACLRFHGDSPSKPRKQLAMFLRVSGNGRVTQADANLVGVEDEALAGCLESEASRLRFPRFPQKEVRFSFPVIPPRPPR